jgi:RNA polymerase sigma-70 factor (ECF subfamily)
MDKKSDRYLIEACLKKDLAAWGSLVNKYSALVYVAVENRLKKYSIPALNQDIEDIRQNIFSDIWKNDKLSRITNRDDISYWIAILSGNAAVEHFRSAEARRIQNTVPILREMYDKDMNEIFQSGIPGPNDELARAETEDKMNSAIESLPGREKVMLKLNLIHGKKYHEISELMGVPAGTVSSYIKRAKEKIRAALKNN